MQNRVRKNRYIKVSRRFRKDSLTCIRKIAYQIVFISLITACSTTRIKHKLDNAETEYKDLMDKICLSSEGKGRIKFVSERNSFRYESMLDDKDEIWSMAISIPLYGEEIIRLKFKDAYKDKVKAYGNFYERLVAHSRKNAKSREDLKLLNKVLKKYGLFLKSYVLYKDGYKSVCKGIKEINDEVIGSCKISKADYDWKLSNGGLFLKFFVDNTYNFHVEFLDANDANFERMHLVLVDKNEDSVNPHPIELDLYVDDCF